VTGPKRQPRGARLVEVHLRLPLEVVERLERGASKKGLTLSAYVRIILEDPNGRSSKTDGSRAGGGPTAC